ncbi:MAG: peptide MFS transporter [Pseudomonadota bacterium]
MDIDQQKIKQPNGIYFLFTVEMWERFNYYGMRALLVLFMTKFLMFNTEKAGTVYGWFTGLVYMTPLIGGYIADRYWGKGKAIIVGCILMAIGQFIMAYTSVTASVPLFYFSLLVIVIGNGFFKPNIAATVGLLYEKNDPRRDGGFTIFYMGVNLGAFMAPIVCGTLGERMGWGYGFAAAGVGMLIGLFTFMWGNKRFLGDKAACPRITNAAGEKSYCHGDAPLTKDEKQRIAVIFIMMFFVIFFWASFEQAGSSLTLFAEYSTNRVISVGSWTWTIPTTWFQSLNPLFIFMLAPFFARFWIKLAIANKEPATVYKFVWGLVLLALGFVVMVGGAYGAAGGKMVGMIWLIGAYLLHTMGELCLSPVGLSMVTKLSPLKFTSLLLGVWHLANFAANLVSGLFAANYDAMDHALFFMVPIATAGGAALLLTLLAKPIRRWMHGVH